jgi:hypothetical protein
MKKILHILLLPIVLAASCKKDGLTKETQTGANTFSCKVNGKVYTPSGGDGWSVWPIEGGGYQDTIAAALPHIISSLLQRKH